MSYMEFKVRTYSGRLLSSARYALADVRDDVERAIRHGGLLPFDPLLDVFNSGPAQVLEVFHPDHGWSWVLIDSPHILGSLGGLSPVRLTLKAEIFKIGNGRYEPPPPPQTFERWDSHLGQFEKFEVPALPHGIDTLAKDMLSLVEDLEDPDADISIPDSPSSRLQAEWRGDELHLRLPEELATLLRKFCARSGRATGAQRHVGRATGAQRHVGRSMEDVFVHWLVLWLNDYGDHDFQLETTEWGDLHEMVKKYIGEEE